MADKPETAPQLKGLDHDFINTLMASSRQHNVYGPKLLVFMESDEPGINPRESWPLEFPDEKSTQTIATGFRNAAREAKLDDQLIITTNDGQVYILHKERVAAVKERAASNGSK
jgi:hypothetical protein